MVYHNAILKLGTFTAQIKKEGLVPSFYAPTRSAQC